MAGRKAVQEHGAKARARAGEGDVDEDGQQQQHEPTEAERAAAAQAERERAVMSGGPGGDDDHLDGGQDDHEEHRQEWQTFKYGDKEFTSQEALTSYIDGLQAARQVVVPQEPARQQPQTPAERKRAGETIDFDKELYTDPKKVFGQFRDEIKAEIQAEMSQQYTADQTMRKFWQDFYGKNKDLEGKEFFVQAVFNRELPRIGDMPIQKSLDELSKAVRAEALNISGGQQRGDGRSAERQRTLVEAGNGPASRGNGEQRRTTEREPPRTLSAMIRQRQAAHSRANRTAAT